ncbi:MAG: peptidase [Bacteroidota bacterium]
MKRQFYIFTNFILGLSAVAALFQSLLFICLGAEVVRLDSFVGWLITISIVSLTGHLFVIKYYQHKRFGFPFVTGIIVVLPFLCLVAVTITILVNNNGVTYYRPMQIAYTVTSVLYALSLLTGGARKHFWLRIAGIYGFIISLSVLVIFIYAQPVQQHFLLDKTLLWLAVAGSFMPVPFILNFVGELRTLKASKVEAPDSESADTSPGIITLIFSAFIVVLGFLLISDHSQQVYWGKKNFENTVKLYKLFEARHFINSKGDTLFYSLLKPLNYDPRKKYPLVVSLPYGGQPGTDKIRQIEGAQAAEILSTDENRKKYPAFLFIPNCPNRSGWGGIPGWPSVDTLVYKAIEALDTAFSIDVKRRYVTGISRGGYGAWHFICTRPDLFAAAIPISGGEDPKLAPKIVNVAVWAFHGAKDRNVPVSGSRNMISAMKKAGVNPKYTEYPHQGHNIGYSVSQTPGLWDWLFAQKRK